jgi:transcriptional regulator with XRE-family HTH domain
MGTFISRFEIAIKKSGLKKSEIGRKMGVSRTTMTDWSTNPDKHPPSSRMEELAEIFGTTAEWLEGSTDDNAPMQRKNITAKEIKHEIHKFEKEVASALGEKSPEILLSWKSKLLSPNMLPHHFDFAGKNLLLRIQHASLEKIARRPKAFLPSAREALWMLATQKTIDAGRQTGRKYCLMVRITVDNETQIDEVSTDSPLVRAILHTSANFRLLKSEAELLDIEVHIAACTDDVVNFIFTDGRELTDFQKELEGML